MAKVLDKGGIFLAFAMGVVITLYGGPEYLALILFFFVIGIIVTRYEYTAKKEMGIYEHERGWENVLSNGLVPTIAAFLSMYIGPMPYIAAVAAVTSDTFGSELGVLEKGKPISLETLKAAKPGTSGAISVMGSVASLGGATAIGAAAIVLFGITPTVALAIGVIGFIGSFVDSIFGIFEEKGFGTKGTTNFICSLSGAILAYLLLS